MEKVYEVEFLNYTNCMRDTVSNGAKDIKDTEYINVGKEPFLIRESEFEKYMRELYVTCNFFDRSEPPYITINKDVIPDSFIERT